MITVMLAVLGLFAWIRFMALAEPVSYDSGANLFATIVMALIVLTLASASTLNVTIDEKYLRIKFGWGIFRKKFLIGEIASARSVKNRWYYGWGIRFCLRPYMVIFNVSGFDAVEITMKNGKVYRIGTDDPAGLEAAIKKAKGI